MTDKGTWAKPTNALEIADELLEPVQGFPAPTQLEQRAADALRRQHQIILTLEAAQAQAAVEPISKIKLLTVTTAYEQGVGKGRQRYLASSPYAEGTIERDAWQLGYQEGIDMERPPRLALLDEIERKRDIIQKVLNNSSRADWPDDIYKELMEARK